MAIDLKLNANKYTTYAQMAWKVVSNVNLNMPCQPMDMWIDHVEKEECERKGESKGTGKSWGTGAAKKALRKMPLVQ